MNGAPAGCVRTQEIWGQALKETGAEGMQWSVEGFLGGRTAASFGDLGQALKGGHFFPEESPDDTAVLLKRFLSA